MLQIGLQNSLTVILEKVGMGDSTEMILGISELKS